MDGAVFPSTGLFDVVLNIASVIILFGPAYLANTGAMLFGKWIPDLFGVGNHKIDSGKNWYDGNRALGDGKSWEGLIGGAAVSSCLTVAAHKLWEGNTTSSNRPFLDPLAILEPESWYHFDDLWISAAIIGFILGMSCMIGDSVGSFVKRRKGLRREGDVSSKAPLLDTLPFAFAILLSTLILFKDTIYFESSVRPYAVALLVLTPAIHRMTNILGYKIGLKSVPY